jgi:hypothetical protein
MFALVKFAPGTVFKLDRRKPFDLLCTQCVLHLSTECSFVWIDRAWTEFMFSQASRFPSAFLEFPTVHVSSPFSCKVLKGQALNTGQMKQMVLDSLVWVITTFIMDLSFQRIPQKQKDKTFFRQDNRIDRISKESFLGYLVHPVNPV